MNGLLSLFAPGASSVPDCHRSCLPPPPAGGNGALCHCRQTLPMLRSGNRTVSRPLPKFVRRKFEDYLRYGLLEHGRHRPTLRSSSATVSTTGAPSCMAGATCPMTTPAAATDLMRPGQAPLGNDHLLVANVLEEQIITGGQGNGTVNNDGGGACFEAWAAAFQRHPDRLEPRD
jgi:hypothetical protein